MAYISGGCTAEWAVGKVFITDTTIPLGKGDIEGGSLVKCISVEGGVGYFVECETGHEWHTKENSTFMFLTESEFFTKNLEHISTKQIKEYTVLEGKCYRSKSFIKLFLLFGFVFLMAASFASIIFETVVMPLWIIFAVCAVGVSIGAVLHSINRKERKEYLNDLQKEPYVSILEGTDD